ncbi:MAG: gliding motility protein GldN [Dysgonamonadaceae bacterium]|jgi:gliding motility associated protien GldN|nr:gliding motility protein GldN [Dysgonamonadaceae bacterium]
MKPFYYIVLLLLAGIFAQDALSQTQTPQQRRQTPRQRADAEKNDLPVLTTRAASKNEDQSKNIDNMVWIREVYRWIDLRKENNSALYFPEQPIEDRMNLFTLLFKLVAQGQVPGYEYLDGREIFTDAHKVNFENILKNYQIIYTSQGAGNQIKYTIQDSDIPSNEVLMYTIKEAWYFDQATGMFNSRILAICPMLLRQEDEFAEPVRIPLFWLRYEDIRPYISRALIMTSNLNNALTYSIDDFFNKKMYVGEIVKTTNMMNRSLAQEVGNDPEKLKLAQDSIESQLKFFEGKLWVPVDSTATANKKDAKKDSKKTTNDTKETKPKESKIESGPTKSVRRTR